MTRTAPDMLAALLDDLKRLPIQAQVREGARLATMMAFGTLPPFPTFGPNGLRQSGFQTRLDAYPQTGARRLRGEVAEGAGHGPAGARWMAAPGGNVRVVLPATARTLNVRPSVARAAPTRAAPTLRDFLFPRKAQP